MPKRNNSKKNVSSKNILKKMKDLSEYYRKKIMKGGDGDAVVAQTQADQAQIAADNAAKIAAEAARVAEEKAAAETAAAAKTASAAPAVEPEKPWYQFWGGKSNKRRRNRNRKQTHKKRN